MMIIIIGICIVNLLLQVDAKIVKTPQKLSWNDAENMCTFDMKGNIFPSRDIRQYEAAKDICGSSECWIGLHRHRPDSQYIVNTIFTKYDAHWRADEPSFPMDANGRHCVKIDAQGKAVTENCDKKYHVLCEVS